MLMPGSRAIRSFEEGFGRPWVGVKCKLRRCLSAVPGHHTLEEEDRGQDTQTPRHGCRCVGNRRCFSAGFATSAAAEYPTRDITMIVPFAAGGGSDVVARNIANVINGLGLLPVTVIVENRPRGSGAIGYSYLAQQEGNPYYVGTVSAGFFTTPLTGGSPVTYRDFTPLAAIATDPFVLAVGADSDIHTLEDLQAQGSLVTGTSGAVSDPTMLAHILEEILDISIQVVPYDSGARFSARSLVDTPISSS